MMTLLDGKHGRVCFWPAFLSPARAGECFQILRRELAWKQEHYTVYGRRVAAPRLTAWYGDAGASYRYSGVDHQPLPWHPLLLDLKQLVEQHCGTPFNAVLANRYRDGRDSMGWHADDEPELGRDPVIASLSLGATRLFKLRPKGKKNREGLDIPLPAGSLLLMAGALQHHWQHSLPKTRRPVGERINLTFRQVLGAEKP